MAQDDKYPRVTAAQFEIWMNLPVTKTFLLGLRFALEHAEEDIKPVLDPQNSDASHAYLFELQGLTAGLKLASNPLDILKRSELYEHNGSERANS